MPPNKANAAGGVRLHSFFPCKRPCLHRSMKAALVAFRQDSNPKSNAKEKDRYKTCLFVLVETEGFACIFRRGDSTLEMWSVPCEKSRYSPVCELVHAQPTGLCGHDSNPYRAKTRGPFGTPGFLARDKGFACMFRRWASARRAGMIPCETYRYSPDVRTGSCRPHRGLRT